jgi:hypothetical protein
MHDDLYNWQFYIQESKAKEKRKKKGSSTEVYGRPYITLTGHVTSIRSATVFPWPGQGNQDQSGLSRNTGVS